MTFQRGITITVIPGEIGVDDNGDPIADSREQHDVENCAVAPRFSDDEQTERGRAGVIVGQTIYAPYGADILRTDQIVIPGLEGVYEVDGEPGPWRSPWTGWEAGLQVAVRRAEG